MLSMHCGITFCNSTSRSRTTSRSRLRPIRAEDTRLKLISPSDMSTTVSRERSFRFENKRVSEEGAGAVWSAASDQFLHYMKRARTAYPMRTATYGIVTVGRYSRYYTLSPRGEVLSDFKSSVMDYKGELLHFKDNEDCMHTLLEELVQLASQHG